MAGAQPMRHVDPSAVPRDAMYFLLNSVIVPRPIAWVSSLAPDGTLNLAPHSYATIASVAPPTLLFTSIREKDTVRNVRATGSFVVSVVDRELAERMNVTAADAPPHRSEFELAGLTPAASAHVPVPRVAEAPVAIECELDRVVEIGSDPSFVVFGRVLAMHVAERLYDDRDRLDPARLDAVARMGGSVYSTTRDRFSLVRPRFDDLVRDAMGD